MDFRKLYRNPTLIFILSIIFLAVGIPYGIYGLTLDGGASLGGVLIIIADIIVFIIFRVDRVLAKKIQPVRLSFYELGILIIGISIYIYSNRKIIVEIENEKVEYLLVIENPGDLENDKTTIEFPINKKILTKRNTVIVNKMVKDIDFIIEADWNNSYYYKTYRFEKYPRVKLFCKSNNAIRKDLNQNLIDSLIIK